MSVAEVAVQEVVVRYWASARAAAGCASDRVAPGTLAAVLDEVRGMRPGDLRFARVVSMCSVLVDETPVGTVAHDEVLVGAGSVIELLPPFAGG